MKALRRIRPDCQADITWLALFNAHQEHRRLEARLEAQRHRLDNWERQLGGQTAELMQQAAQVVAAKRQWRRLLLFTFAMGCACMGTIWLLFWWMR